MAKKLLGLMLAILMACPTVSFAQDDSLKGIRSAPAGAHVKLVMRDGDEIWATLIRVEESSVVVSGVEASERPRVLQGVIVDGRVTYALGAATISSSHHVIESKTAFTALTGASDPDLGSTKARQLRVGSKVEVRLRDGTQVRGRVSELFADALVVRRGRWDRTTIAYSDMASLNRARMTDKGKAAVAAVAIGGAALLGRLFWDMKSQ